MPKPYIPNDRLAMKARDKGFRARSVFKLEELDQKFNLIKEGTSVLDIGAAPGSWLQYASKKLGSKGILIGIDLKPIAPVASNTYTYVTDITDHARIKEILSDFNLGEVDLILSDIAPNTTGIKYVDQKRSVELNQAIVKTAKTFLKSGGRLVMKVFPGEDFDRFLKELKRDFKNTYVTKTQASRERSREVYIICQ